VNGFVFSARIGNCCGLMMVECLSRFREVRCLLNVVSASGVKCGLCSDEPDEPGALGIADSAGGWADAARGAIFGWAGAT